MKNFSSLFSPRSLDTLIDGKYLCMFNLMLVLDTLDQEKNFPVFSIYIYTRGTTLPQGQSSHSAPQINLIVASRDFVEVVSYFDGLVIFCCFGM